MEVFRRAGRFYRQTFLIFGGSLLGSFFAGIVLGGGSMTSAMERVPGILLIIPAFLATRGNVYGAMGARIATALHQGLIEPRFAENPRLMNALKSSLINGTLASGFIGVAGWSLLQALGRNVAPFWMFVSILVVSGVISAGFMSAILVYLLFLGYRRGIDPDVLSGPLITSIGDFLGMFILFFSIVGVRWLFGV